MTEIVPAAVVSAAAGRSVEPRRSISSAPRPDILPYQIFDLRVAEIVSLAPHFRRVVLESPQLREFADHGWDQRIKVVLPLAGDRYTDFPVGADWRARWRQLPSDRQNPLRTYTVRRVTDPGTAGARLHVDMVVHGDSGPASAWVGRAAVGSRLLVIGPNALHPLSRAVEFRPHPAARRLVIGADETALPAVAGILERLPAHARGVAVLEVPHDADRLPITAPPGIDVRWLVRGDKPSGAALLDGVLHGWSGPAAADAVDDAGATRLMADLRWDVPPVAAGCESPVYVWLAGEAGAVTAVRRQLVGTHGVCRDAVTFMGYWRRGVAGH